MCKAGGSLHPFASRLAEPGGGGHGALAELLQASVAHPATAQGALHWLRHALLAASQGGEGWDPRAPAGAGALAAAAAAASRFGLAVADAWPLLAVGCLGLLRQNLRLSPPAPAAAVMAAADGAAGDTQEGVVARMASLALSGTCAMPVLTYARLQALAVGPPAPQAGGEGGGGWGWPLPLLRRLLTQLVLGLEPPLAPALALELVRIAHATQARVAETNAAAAAAAATAAATGASRAGTAVGGGGPFSLIARSASAPPRPLGAPPSSVAAPVQPARITSVTLDRRRELQLLLERVFAAFHAQQAEHDLLVQQGGEDAAPPDPVSGAPAREAHSARQEVLTLIAQMNGVLGAHDVL